MTRKSKPRGEAQRVGDRWEPDADGGAEWACELCAERIPLDSTSPQRERCRYLSAIYRVFIVVDGYAPYMQREVGLIMFLPVFWRVFFFFRLT